MVRVQSAAGVSSSSPAMIGKSVRRRDLRQQSSRVALMSAIGLAAFAGASLGAPGDALADCAITPTGAASVITCGATVTTNTTFPVGQPNSRAIATGFGNSIDATITQGSAVTGYGLAFGVTSGAGALNVVNNGSISVDSGLTPTQGGGAALSLESSGGSLTYSGAGALTNNGLGQALSATQLGAGRIDLDIGGDVTSTNGGGLVLRDTAAGTGISVSTRDVTAFGTGIDVESRSAAGDLVVTVDGDVRSAFGAVEVNNENSASTGDIRVNVSGELTGTRRGVLATTEGSGDIAVAVGGPISVGSNGITARTVNGSITVSSGDIVAEGTAVSVTQSGAGGGGGIQIATGDLTGEGGVFAKGSGSGGINITTGSVNAVFVGVTIDNGGAGPVNYTADGAITANGASGVSVTDTAVGDDISVATRAITALNGSGVSIESSSRTADIRIVADGDIRAGTIGLAVSKTDVASTGDINITALGRIEGQGGIAVIHQGQGSVAIAAGTVNTTEGGISVEAGGGNIDITAGEVETSAFQGIYARNNGAVQGDISIVSGPVTGALGIEASNNSAGHTRVVTTDQVTGAEAEGILIGSLGSVEVRNDGLVSGATHGLRIAGGNVDADITVRGSGGYSSQNGNAVDITNRGSGDVDFSTSGAITAIDGNGVVIDDDNVGGSVSVRTGSITTGGIWTGVVAESASTNGDVTIVADGDIQAGLGVYAGLFRASSTGDVSVTTTGAITAANAGIVAFNSGSGSLSVEASGDISGVAGGIEAEVDRGSLTIAAGNVSASVGGGIIANIYSGSGDLSLSAGNVSGRAGIFAANQGSGDISIITTGSVTGRVYEGIYAGGSGDITVSVAGTVTGEQVGLYLEAGGTDGDVSVTGTGGFVGETRQAAFIENASQGSTSVDITGASRGETGGIIVRALSTTSGDVRVATGAVSTVSGSAIDTRSASLTNDLAVIANGDVITTGAGEVAVFAALVSAGAAGDLSVTTNGSVTGATGIQTSHAGSGTTTIEAVGPILASTGNGVMTFDTAVGGDIGVTTGDVTAMGAGASAILVDSVASDADITILANGDLRAAGYGVLAELNGTSDNAITVTTRGAVAAQNGIRAVTDGTGAVSVTAEGPVTASALGVLAQSQGGAVTLVADDVAAAGQFGVLAQQAATGGAGDVDVTLGNVSGETGAAVVNAGSGATRIRVNGTVSGSDDNGLEVVAQTGVALTNDGALVGQNGLVLFTAAGDVLVDGSGAFTGLGGNAALISNSGSGAVTFNGSGPLAATNGHGVSVDDTAQGGNISVATGAVTVSGAGFNGINIDAETLSGNLAIVVNGALSAEGGQGVFAYLGNNGATGGVSVETNGSVNGSTGIVAATAGSGAVAIDAGGPVTATLGVGITAQALGGGAVSVVAGDVAGERGVVVSGGLATVRTSGRVTGFDREGMVVEGRSGASITVGDSVSGATSGLFAEVGASGTGAISVTGAGGFVGTAGNGAALNNLGSGTVFVDIAGPVVGNNGSGLLIRDTAAGGDISVRTGAASATGAGFNAIDVFTSSENASVDITANGPLSASGGVAMLGLIQSAISKGNITLTSTGAATGVGGLYANNFGSGSATITSTGPIVATGEFGILANTVSGPVTVTTGDVTGLFAIVARTAGASAVSVTANGAAIGTVGDGLLATGEGAVSVVVDGSVTGAMRGVVVRGGAQSGDLSITGAGSVTGRNGHAVSLYNAGAGTATVDLAGPITATGGSGVIVTDSGVSDDVSVTTGDVSAVSGDFNAIHVVLESDVADIDVTANGAVTAGGAGILAVLNENTAKGEVRVTANGPVSGDFGVDARNLGTGGITVATGGVITATEGSGILADARTGGISITATGDIVSTAGTGAGVNALIRAGGEDLSIAVGDATGARGVSAVNNGTGAISIAATGAVTGTVSEGLQAIGSGPMTIEVGGTVTGVNRGATLVTNAGATGDITVTGAGGFVGQSGAAAYIQSGGSGAIVVDIAGASRATGGSGIVALDTNASAGMDISTGDVAVTGAGSNAIDARSRSLTGDVTVVANGDLEAEQFGVLALLAEGTATGAVTVATLGAVEASNGVYANNAGAGAVEVVARGAINATDGFGVRAETNGGEVRVTADNVTAAGTGVIAQVNGGGGIVNVEAGDVTGGRGVHAISLGRGLVRVAGSGTITGTDDYGVLAETGQFSEGVFVDVTNVSGADVGVATINTGVGATVLQVRGTVEGGLAAISAASSADQAVLIRNDGVIRNASGLSADRAIEASGGSIDFTNAGRLVGDINFNADSSIFDNRGTWNAVGGDSSFAGADDELINAATGSILAGSTSGVADVTLFRGLESFRNAGRLSMADGGAGDVVATTANAVFAAGSVLQLDISGQSLADAFTTTGTLSIQPGARLQADFIQPLSLTGRYVVAQAAGGLTGTFDFEERLLSAFIGLRDGYTATTAYIEIGQLRAMMEAGLTPNQRQTAAGADSLAQTNPLKTALLLLPDDAAAQDAFDQLSGEIHPTARRAMADDSRQFRDAVLDRLSDDEAQGAVWGQVLAQERVTDADGNAAKVEHDARGLMFGVDRALTDHVTVGLAGGWFDTSLDVRDRGSEGSTRSLQAMAYAGAERGPWRVRAGAGYARTTTETERQIAFAGFTASPTADYDGSVLQAFAEAGYRIDLGAGFVEPFANLTGITAETDAFHEVDGPAALAVEATSEELTVTTLGVRFQTDRTGALSLRGTAGWRNVSGDLEPTGRHAFDGGSTFTVLGGLHSDVAAVANLEAQWRLSPNIVLGAAWDGVFGNQGEDHAVSAKFRMSF